MDLRSTNGRLRRAITPIFGSEDPPKAEDPPEEVVVDPPALEARTYTQDDIDALQRRMQAADRAKTAAEKELKERQDAEKSELEKAKADLAAAVAEKDAAEKSARDAIIAAEILKYPTRWHDPDAVLRLIDLDGIEINEDGKVTGVKEAVTALAKKSPFLLQADEEPKGKKAEKKDGPPSGHSPESGAPDDRADQREMLREKYKILN